MSNMTSPKKPEHADKREDIGNDYIIERRLMGYSYAKSGNMSNPTPNYYWSLYLDGELVDTSHRRTPLCEGARRDDYR